ncbi:FMN-binding protein [Actinoplanes sp. HUAS TT8]|uniref:FMN-binding protein n=1 Tax=Actinoplanes sp. HUAS TT8 TaxID=3447453 RepID=UPI003F51B548
MRRITLWMLSTVAVLVLLFSYRTSTNSSAAAATTAAVATGTGGGTTYTGDTASTRWGDVQVQITVADGKITSVSVPVYPNENGRDQEINATAIPTLVQETLSAQSAKIDTVSGATVTSDGYLQSLQSALDAAHLS